MKRTPFTNTLIIIAVITLLTPVPFGAFDSFKNYLEAFSVSTFAISLLLLLPAIAISIPQGTRKVGQAMLLSSAVLLLLSFTLCSTGAVNFSVH